MDPDRCFLRLAVDRGLVPAALAEECAAQAPPGAAARLLVERARLRPDIAQALHAEAQRVARSHSGGVHSSLAASAVGRLPGGPNASGVQTLGRSQPDAGRTVAGRPGGGAWQPGAQFGRFRLEEELGRGGMGIVWRARQLDLDRDVALKMLIPGRLADERIRQRFLAEARAVARLSHPHIVGIYDVGELDGALYFTMEYVDGGSLGSLPPGDSLPAARVVEIGRALAGALESAHQAGIVHRDLKPANVLLARDGTPRLTDFGIAKDLQGGSITQSGEILGTPAYMSPEQADGRSGSLDGRTDIYALGAILYRLLTGRPPFEAGTPYEVLRKVMASAVVPPRRLQGDVPPALEAVVLRCLEKDPARRFDDATALRDALDEVQDELGPGSGAEDELAPASLAPPGWFWPALLAGLLVLVGAGLSVAWWREHVRAERERRAHEELLAAQAEKERQAREEAVRVARAGLDEARRDPRGALRRLEELARSARDVPEVQAALGELRLEVGGDAQGALEALDAALAADEGQVAARAARGRCLVRLGRDPAEVQQEVDRLEPLGLAGKAAAAELRGELALREGKGSLATSQLGEAVRRLPDDPRLRRRLARALLGIHRHEQALEELEHAQRLQPGSAEQAGLRARALLQLERRDEARQAADQALKTDPEQADAREVMQALGEGEHGPDDPAHQRTHAALSALRQGLQRGEPVKRLLELWAEAMAERDATCISALTQRADMARHLRRLPEARQDLLRLLAVLKDKRRDQRAAFVQLIEVDTEMNRFSDAERELEALRAAVPADDPLPWLLQAELRKKQNRPDDALLAFDKAVELAPQDAEIVHERGHLHQAGGRREEALRDMLRAVELGGRRPGHYRLVSADLMLELGRSDEARAAYEAALQDGLPPPEEKHAREALARLSGPSEPPR